MPTPYNKSNITYNQTALPYNGSPGQGGGGGFGAPGLTPALPVQIVPATVASVFRWIPAPKGPHLTKTARQPE